MGETTRGNKMNPQVKVQLFNAITINDTRTYMFEGHMTTSVNMPNLPMFTIEKKRMLIPLNNIKCVELLEG